MIGITKETISPDTWLEEHGDALYRFALLQLRDVHKAEEVVQETLLAALQSLDRFQGGSSVRTWLIGILKYKVLDQFRREAKEAPLQQDSTADEKDDEAAEESFQANGHWKFRLGDWGNPQSALESDQFWDILQACLELLPQRQSRLFVLRELFEEKTENICKELAITPTNLWTMLYRARMALRKCLDRNWVGEVQV